MSYIVTAIGEATGPITPDAWTYWKSGQSRMVAPECIAWYSERPDTFTVVDGPDIEKIMFSDSAATTASIATRLFAGTAACALIDFNNTAEAEMTVTIGGITYTEADEADAETGIFTNGASAADSAASLLAAINGDERTAKPFTAVADVSGDGVWVFWDAVGEAGNVEITTTSAANCTVHEEAYNGADPAIKRQVSFSHTVGAQELLSGALEFPLPFVPSTLMVQVHTATGAPVYFTDLVTVEDEPTRLRIATDGATNIAATNVVHVLAYE